METEQMYNHNITPAPLLLTIYSPSAKHQTPLRLLTWVYTSHYLLFPRQNLKMIIIYNYYMLQPDTSLSRFANQPNSVIDLSETSGGVTSPGIGIGSQHQS
jgi:hypothetical protein